MGRSCAAAAESRLGVADIGPPKGRWPWLSGPEGPSRPWSPCVCFPSRNSSAPAPSLSRPGRRCRRNDTTSSAVGRVRSEDRLLPPRRSSRIRRPACPGGGKRRRQRRLPSGHPQQPPGRCRAFRPPGASAGRRERRQPPGPERSCRSHLPDRSPSDAGPKPPDPRVPCDRCPAPRSPAPRGLRSGCTGDLSRSAAGLPPAPRRSPKRPSRFRWPGDAPGHCSLPKKSAPSGLVPEGTHITLRSEPAGVPFRHPPTLPPVSVVDPPDVATWPVLGFVRCCHRSPPGRFAGPPLRSRPESRFRFGGKPASTLLRTVIDVRESPRVQQ